jgi:hypothetical protein
MSFRGTTKLTVNEAALSGFTHQVTITSEDLQGNDFAGTAFAADTSGAIFKFPRLGAVESIATFLETPFDGGSDNSLILDVGKHATAASGADELIASQELHVDATEVLTEINSGDGFTIGSDANTGNSVAIAANDFLTAKFTTSGSEALTVLTTGKLHIFFKYIDPFVIVNDAS